MSTTPFPTASVVKVLIQDVPLSHGSEEFARLLGIDAVTRNKIYKKHILETSTSTDYYTNLLQNWVGRKGNDATVDALRGILEDGEFKSASGMYVNRTKNTNLHILRKIIRFLIKFVFENFIVGDNLRNNSNFHCYIFVFIY